MTKLEEFFQRHLNKSELDSTQAQSSPEFFLRALVKEVRERHDTLYSLFPKDGAANTGRAFNEIVKEFGLEPKP